MRVRDLVAVAAAVILQAALGQAQEARPVTVDDKVRLTLIDDQQFIGTVAGPPSQSLDILIPGTGRQAFELGTIQRLERSEGFYRDGNVWLGAGIGALAGGLGGLLIAGYAQGISEGGQSTVSTGAAIAIGAGTGAIAGAIIGSGPKREDWREVPLESLQLGVGPVGNGKWGLVASFVF
jgi:hypothetical protein